MIDSGKKEQKMQAVKLRSVVYHVLIHMKEDQDLSQNKGLFRLSQIIFNNLLTALTGRGFKKACHDSFYLMIRHEKYFSSLYGLGSLMLLLGKLFICCSSTFLCYLILSDNERFKNDLYSPILPTIVIAYITFTIGNIFVTVYSSSSDSILQCYCVDEELHNEMKESTNNTPEKLTVFLDKYTDKIKDQKANGV